MTTILKFREDAQYKKLLQLLKDYPQEWIDRFYLSNIEDDEFYDTIAENDSPELASRAFTIVFPVEN